MKKILLIIICFVTLKVASQSTCSLTTNPTSANITCGQSLQLSASGAGGANLMNNDFNTGTVGAGWSASASAQFNNPCLPGLDGSTHLWMGNTTAAPRSMVTIPYNIACSGTICFDLVFGSTLNTPCEEPDLSTEGVDLAYSTDNGATWTSITYFDPITGLYDAWANYCFAIPAGAISPNTMFSWSQTNSSGADFDHWGIDNVNITLTGACATAAPYYYSWLPTTGLNNPAIANPIATPLTTTTYTLYFTNGIDDTCTAFVPVTVNGPTADAGTMQTICLGQSATLSGSGSSGLPTTTTFTNTTTTSIVDNTTVTNTITVSGLPYTTISVNDIVSVCIDNIDHSWDSDLDIFLISPNGTMLELSTDNGGSGDDYIQTCFKPSATASITTGTAPMTGTFIPEGAGGLSVFTGSTSNGGWVLQVGDDAGGDVGTINAWSITFNVPAVTTPSWSPTANMSGSNTFNPVLTPTVTGITQYTITVDGNPGCSSTDTVSVFVNELAGVTVSAMNNVFCESDSTVLNATGGVSYTWSPATGLNSNNVASPVASPTTTTNYTVVVSDGTCTKVDSVLITVNPRPLTNAGTNVSYCFNDSVQLGASGADSYMWSPGVNLNSTTIPNPVCSSDTTISYIVTGMITATGCFRTDTIVVTVDTLPIAGAGIDTAYCVGGSVVLNASGGGTYNWLPATNISNSTVSNPTVNPSTSVSYTLTVTNSFGCIDKDTINVTVHALPLVDAGPNGFTCLGTPRQLNATGAVNYVWTPAATLSNDSINNPLASPSVLTTYTVVGTDAFGCSKSDVVTVGIYTVATVSMSASSTSVCAGQSTTLNAAGTPSSYTWSPAGTLGSTSGPSVVATPTAPTTYTVQFATPGNGCIGRDSITISILPQPTVSFSGNQNICPGDSTTISAIGGSTYLWSPSAGLNNTNSSTVLAGPSASTNYTVMVTDANGCNNVDSIWVYAQANPVSGTITSTVTGCLANTGSVTMATPTGGVTPYSYSLNGGSSQSSSTFSNLAAGNYLITVIDSFGCMDTASVVVSTAPNPVPGAISATPSGCTVSVGSLAMQNPTVGTAPFVYSLDGGIPQASGTFTGLGSGTYTITVTDSFGCSDTLSGFVGISANPSAGSISSTPTGCVLSMGSLTMQSSSGGVPPYTYSINGGTVQTSNTFTGLAAGSYVITVTDSNGCTDTLSGLVSTAPNPVPGTITATPSACTSSTGILSMQNPSTGTAPFSFILNGGTPQTSNTFTSLAVGSYTITVVDSFGCSASDTSSIAQQNAPSITGLSTTNAICTSTSGSINVAGVTGGTGPFVYSVNSGSPQTSATLVNLTANAYTVTVTDANGCSDTDTVTVPMTPSTVVLDTAALVSSVCGSSTGSINVTLPTGGTSPYTYSIDGLTFQSSPLFSNLASANYPVIVMDSNGCTDTGSFFIGTEITAIATFESTPPSGVYPLPVTFTNNSSGANHYVWSFGNGTANSISTNSSTTYTAAGTYTVQLIAYNNIASCADTAWATILVIDEPQLVVPNIVTSNSDGVNDEFKLIGYNYKSIDVTIIDRWGRKVTAYTGDLNTSWKPDAGLEGTFFYVIKATTLDDKIDEYTGYLTILGK